MQMQGKIAHHFVLEHVPYGGEEGIKESGALRCGESVCAREREREREEDLIDRKGLTM